MCGFFATVIREIMKLKIEVSACVRARVSACLHVLMKNYTIF